MAIAVGALFALFISAYFFFRTGEPKFTIRHRVSAPFYAGWVITNEDTSPLEVRRVSINGEFDAPPALRQGDWFAPDHSRAWPLSATIGESIYAYQLNTSVTKDPGYTKKTIFVDIDTNRGRFRYTPEDESLVAR